MSDREGTQEQGVNDSQDGGVDSNAERDGNEGDSKESRTLD
jgi:hypothetical protein